MLSCLLTIVFYGACITLVMKQCPTLSSRLLRIGTLPVAWISLCGIAGLLDTLLRIPPLFLLGPVVASVVMMSVTFRRSISTLNQNQAVRLPWWAIVISSVCMITVGVDAHWIEPWGGWDAMFTWVLRARFLTLGGDQWKNAFSNDLALLHPDYPPMLSWALHALWRVDGQISSLAIATLFSPLWPAFLLLVFGFQAIATERIRLTISTAAILATPILWRLAASVLSDFALIYAILGSCAFYAYTLSKQDKSAAYIAGFLAAWGGLTKNEGLAWLIAFMTVAVGTSFFSKQALRRQTAVRLITGAITPLVAVILFKVMLAPPSDLVNPTRCFEIGELVQPGVLVSPSPLIVRLDQAEFFILHWLIWSRFGQMILEWEDWGITVWLCFFLFAIRIRRPGPASPLLIAVGLQIAVYYLVYLITPYHPYWHLATSLNRIIAHIVPAVLCLLAFDAGGESATFSSRPGGTNTPNSSSKNASTIATPSALFGNWTTFLTKHPFMTWSVWGQHVAALYLVAVSISCLTFLLLGIWKLGQQPAVNLAELREIGLPTDSVVSYVTSNLGDRDLYATQFEAAPSVLVVDRREATLLARFPNESELRRYCEKNQWQIVSNQGGLGWARDNGGSGLRQPVEVSRIK